MLQTVSLLLALCSIRASAQAPAYCPVEQIFSCKDVKDLKCSPKIWHGIDSLDVFELAYLNETAIKIRSLNDTFKDTVARVVVKPRYPEGDDTNPLHCIKAPPISTRYSNCTTHLEAYFSDAGQILSSAIMDSCGIISWMNGFGTYGSWVHADEPTPAPAADMCKFNADTEVYHEVGTLGKTAKYFTVGTINSTAVAIKSLNGSFPDTTASLKIVHGAQEKIAFTAHLFEGATFHGIMRSNGAGTPNCCETPRKGKSPTYWNCPNINWWSADGKRSCWETTVLPHENEGSCNE